MKTVVLKYVMILPIILFALWVGLTLFGCVSCIFGASEVYYCNAYCVISRTAVAVVLVAYIVFFGRAMFVEWKHPSA